MTRGKRIYVLDTNVLMHDPTALFKFEEHDVYLPMQVIEELDNGKKGTSEASRNARQVSRFLNELIEASGLDNLADGIPLVQPSGLQLRNTSSAGLLRFQTSHFEAGKSFGAVIPDNAILGAILALKEEHPEIPVVFVSKDINLRIKAAIAGIVSEDYENDRALDDADLMYRGWRPVTEAELEAWAQDMQSRGSRGGAVYRVPHTDQRHNEFLVFPGGELFRVGQIDGGYCFLHEVPDTTKEKHAVLGVRARNEEQRAALSLLLNPEVDLVALLGPAGTGKTLLALAAALQQIKQGHFDSILFTRANTPLGEEIGFLPGTEEEKMAPWMGALFDNIEVLAEMQGDAVSAHKFREEAKELVEVRAMTFMRGRTFIRRFIILDEAQNLTPSK